MTNNQIKSILRSHSIPFYEESGHIYADSMEAGTEEFENVIDMTGKSKRFIYDWLGY